MQSSGKSQVRGGRRNRFKKKQLPHASKKVDAEQNKRIEGIEKKIKTIDRDIEVKWKDVMNDTFIMSPVSIVDLLNPLAQGNTSITRLGDKVQATSIQGRYCVFNDNDNLVPNIWRVIIFWDRGPKGAAPIFSDILDTTTMTSAASNTVYAPYNLKNVPRFKILYDQSGIIQVNQQLTTVLAGATTTTTAVLTQSSNVYHFKIPLKRIVNYGLGNAGTVADISQNGLFGLYLSDIPAASQPPAIVIGTRFLFKDA